MAGSRHVGSLLALADNRANFRLQVNFEAGRRRERGAGWACGGGRAQPQRGQCVHTERVGNVILSSDELS